MLGRGLREWMILILGEQITNIERCSGRSCKRADAQTQWEEGNNGAGNFPPCPPSLSLSLSLSVTHFFPLRTARSREQNIHDGGAGAAAH